MHISKTELGEFLGEKNDLCEQVLKEYALLFDFGKDGVVSALRVFLESFRLPGESQKIERITEAFAQSFFRQKKSGVFLTWDSVHILTFSVIMLNTDLHSPQVKKHMTLDELKVFALKVWNDINRPNLDNHILPMRDHADIVVKKDAGHAVRIVEDRRA